MDGCCHCDRHYHIIAIITIIVIICYNAFADLLLNGIEMKEDLPAEMKPQTR